MPKKSSKNFPIKIKTLLNESTPYPPPPPISSQLLVFSSFINKW
jgi:hypothetical protein